MDLRLYDTLTREKRPLVPLDANNVRMYACGPTVYDFAHIGNGRAAIVFDVLFRVLGHRYGADHVTYVRNITDVDDKINAAALARRERCPYAVVGVARGGELLEGRVGALDVGGVMLGVVQLHDATGDMRLQCGEIIGQVGQNELLSHETSFLRRSDSSIQ